MTTDEAMTRRLLIGLTLALWVALAATLVLAWKLYWINDMLDTACGPGGTVNRLDLTEWVTICQGRG